VKFVEYKEEESKDLLKLRAEIEAMAEQIKSLKNDLQNSRNSLDQQRSRNKLLKVKMGALKWNDSDSKRQLRAMKEERDTMNMNLRACKRELHRKESETEKLKKTIERNKKVCNAWSEKLKRERTKTRNKLLHVGKTAQRTSDPRMLAVQLEEATTELKNVISSKTLLSATFKSKEQALLFEHKRALTKMKKEQTAIISKRDNELQHLRFKLDSMITESDLERMRSNLNALILKRDQELIDSRLKYTELKNIFSKQKHEHTEKLKKIILTKDHEMALLKSELQKAITNQENKLHQIHIADLSNLIVQSKERLERLRLQHAAELKAIFSNNKKELELLRACNVKNLNAIIASNRKEIEKLQAKHKEELANCIAKSKEDMNNLNLKRNAELDDKLQRVQSEFASKLANVIAERDQHLDILQSKHATELGNLSSLNQRELYQLRSDHAAELLEKDKELASIREEHSAKMRSIIDGEEKVKTKELSHKDFTNSNSDQASVNVKGIIKSKDGGAKPMSSHAAKLDKLALEKDQVITRIRLEHKRKMRDVLSDKDWQLEHLRSERDGLAFVLKNCISQEEHRRIVAAVISTKEIEVAKVAKVLDQLFQELIREAEEDIVFCGAVQYVQVPPFYPPSLKPPVEPSAA